MYWLLEILAPQWWGASVAPLHHWDSWMLWDPHSLVQPFLDVLDSPVSWSIYARGERRATFTPRISMLAEDQKSLKIGELSTHSGVPIKTIRYYEELGLVRAVGRTEGHFRLFDRAAVNRLFLIKRLQSLGLSLQEIHVSLSIYDSGNLPCQDIQLKLEQQVSEIDRQIAELSLLRQELMGILRGWSAAPTPQPGEICPNLHI